MMKIIKRIVSCIIVVSMIIVIIGYAGSVCGPLYTGDAFNAIDAFHEIPEDSVEVMVYGSSHAWKGFDVMHMYEMYGIGAYNYGCNWQHINTTSLFIEDSLRTQTPKVICIETWKVNEILSDIDMNGEIYYTKAIPSFDAKKEYLDQCFAGDFDRYLTYYIPLVAFHSNWNNLTQWNFMNPTDDFDFTKTMGYLGNGTIKEVDMLDYTQFEQKELSEDAKAVLDNIVKICKEKNIEIIFYTAPSGYEYNYSEAMRKYSEENGCVYINLYEKLEEMQMDGTCEFQDVGHLNAIGSKKVAEYIGNYIIENYDVTDMRKNPENQWGANLVR